MSYLLIRVNKSHWAHDAGCARDDVPIRCLDGLNVKKNALSVWHVFADKANLRRLIAALAVSGDHLDKVDWILFDEAVPRNLGLTMVQSQGSTPDDHANQHWHRDIVDLTGRTLVNFGSAVYHNRVDLQRTYLPDLTSEIRRLITEGNLDPQRFRPSVSAKLGFSELPIRGLLRELGSDVAAAWKRFWDRLTIPVK